MAPLAPGDDEDRAPSACRRGLNDDGGKVPERKNMTGPAGMQRIEAPGPAAVWQTRVTYMSWRKICASRSK